MLKSGLRLFLLVALLGACDDAEEPPADSNSDANTETTELSDESQDTVPDGLLSGENVAYRFQSLELTEPKVSQRILLNASIAANMKSPPDDPLAVNIVLEVRDWDLQANPIALQVAGGAGNPNMADDPVSYTFREDAEIAFVPAEVYALEGVTRVKNEAPTNLLFPVRISEDEFIVPFRDIRFDFCYGNSAKCSGTDQSAIYGTLTGGVTEEEANAVTVEFSPGSTLGLGDMLRDPVPNFTCQSDSDCEDGRRCDEAQRCVRQPDMSINGKPAFSLAGRFIGRVVPLIP
ncbi:MAG: hypothetical protein RBU37_14055 [Myxococcota bacterium]|jgi:hypothetical protein|nr:hypothetical protein [Myxococcota bacterium]